MEAENDFLVIFKDLGVIIEDGHFAYASGLHGSVYVNKDALFANPPQAMRISRELAAQFKDNSVQTIVGPATGGAILATLTAHQLTEYNREAFIASPLVRAAYTDKKRDGASILRGFEGIIRGRRVMVVDDVITTGSSVAEVIKEVRKLNTTIVGVATLFNRGGITAKQLDVPRLYSLVELKINAWPKSECALCRGQIPINATFGRG